MKSKVIGKELNKYRVIIWDPTRGKACESYSTSSERCPDGCGKCNKCPNELFQVHSPLSMGYYYLCYDCIMKFNKFLTGKPRGSCPVCGFGTYSVGNGIHTCVFGHKWKEESVTKKVVIDNDQPEE